MAKNTIRFTKVAHDALPPAEAGKRITWWDENAKGLCVIVTATGSKTFYVYKWVQGKPERIRIGPYPDLSIEQARKKAAEHIGRIAQGENPQEDRRKLRRDPTFAELFAWYMENHAIPRKRTAKGDQARFDNHCGAIAKKKAASITKADIRALHARIGVEVGPIAANRTLAMIRCAYNKALAHEVIDATSNPAERIEAFPERSRDRRVYPSQMPAFLEAVMADQNESIRDFVLLCLLTGARRSNVLAMRWDELDLTGKLWRIPLTKNGLPHEVPLHDLAVAVLRLRAKKATGQWVFPGPGKTGHMTEPKKGWDRILERADLQGLWIHDLRRTHGSMMADAGASLPIIAKALNHLSQQTTAIYTRLTVDPVREAQDKALAPVAELMAGYLGEG